MTQIGVSCQCRPYDDANWDVLPIETRRKSAASSYISATSSYIRGFDPTYLKMMLCTDAVNTDSTQSRLADHTLHACSLPLHSRPHQQQVIT